jgi:hypothetical protein
MSKSQPTNPSQNNVFEGGSQAYSDDAVEVRTGVTYSRISTPISDPVAACSDPSKTPTSYTDGIAIKIKCKKNPHLVQFISREIIGADGKPISQTMRTTGGQYQTTTDPANPVWNTDTNTSSPYYESGGAHRTDADSLTTFDQPTVSPGPGQTWRATFKAYAICDGHVVREITWVREQTAGGQPNYNVSVAPASALPAWANQQLASQGYPSVP